MRGIGIGIAVSWFLLIAGIVGALVASCDRLQFLQMEQRNTSPLRFHPENPPGRRYEDAEAPAGKKYPSLPTKPMDGGDPNYRK